MAITRTTLSAAVTGNGTRDIPLTSTTGMLAGDLIAVGHEILKVNSIPVAGTARVQRGWAGTAARDHASGASAEFGQVADFAAFGTRSVDGPPRGAGLPHRPIKRVSAAGAINVEHGWVLLSGAGTAMTLAAPTADEDGIELHIIANAATAFVITATDLLRGDSAGTDDDTATFGGAIGDQLHLVADGTDGVWHIITSKNITFA